MGYSIIVPVKAINDYIRESVPITLRLDYPDFEIIILPNDMPDVIEDCLKDPRVRIIPSGRVSPAVKRDMGAEKAKYDRLAFIDDDAYPRADWLKQADIAFAESKADCLGGPAVTPPHNSIRQHASGLFFETIVGGGGMAYRYKPAAKGFFVDDFPTVNMIVTKAAFFAVGGFDSHYWPGEDTKFCLDLVKKNFKIWYSPDLVVWHHRRDVFRPHLKQVGNYGRHRGHFAKVFPETSLRLTYFVPTLFLLANGLLALGGIFIPEAWVVLALMLALYFSLVTVDVLARTREPRQALLTILTCYVSHLFYGAMFIRGITEKRLHSQLR